MKTSCVFVLAMLLLGGVCNAQNEFDTFFVKKSLRIDFALTGNATTQQAAIQQLREEPVWGGPVKNLEDPFNYGG